VMNGQKFSAVIRLTSALIR